MNRRNLGLTALAALIAFIAFDTHADDARATAQELRDRALIDPTAWDVLDSLVTEIGPRPVGSPAMERARDWGLARLQALGLQHVRAEQFTKENVWFRGEESARVTTPYPHELSILGLGNSVPTPSTGIEADIALFASMEDLAAAPAG